MKNNPLKYYGLFAINNTILILIICNNDNIFKSFNQNYILHTAYLI
jgi:hypothetical protein